MIDTYLAEYGLLLLCGVQFFVVLAVFTKFYITLHHRFLTWHKSYM